MLNLKNELKRKLFHQSSLIIPLSYFLLEKKTALIILGSITILFLSADILRFYVKFIRELIFKIFRPIIRDHESDVFFGATYVLIGGFFTVLLFEKNIAITALLYLTISDSIAALVGKSIGWIKINDKSLSGFLAFLISGYLIGLYVTQLHWKLALIGASLTAVIELLMPKKLDDNLIIPVAGGLFLYIFSLILY
jgi:dolichol kinase